MKTKESRGAVSARPTFSEMLKSASSGAEVIAAASSRFPNRTTLEAVYTRNGSTVHLSITQKGGQP
jgi:hypothetical protein